MTSVHWDRFPNVARSPKPRAWLTIQANLGLAVNTVEAYGRSIEGYLAFAAREQIDVEIATREHVAGYVHDLASRPGRQASNVVSVDSGTTLANATLQQRLTAVRLFYDYLVEEGVRKNNPVGRGRYTPGERFRLSRDRGLIPRFHRLPWIPTEEEWRRLIEAVQQQQPRNRLMFALEYDAALRREELCSLETRDIDPAHRLLRIRAETTKNRCGRTIPYSEATAQLHAAYLRGRSRLSREPGLLFLSESPRNYGEPVSIWAWTKIIEEISKISRVPGFTSHTLRHLCLTDLARAGWDIHEIATFAGHRSLETTMRYIHLSGRDLAHKLESGMAQLHAWRIAQLSVKPA